MAENAERRPASNGAASEKVTAATDHKTTSDVALFADGDFVMVSTPSRGRAPMTVNPAMRGTSAILDKGVWRLPKDEAASVVANLRARGVTVARNVYPWAVQRDYRTPDPLPECVVCATPYRRLGVVPRHCVQCGDRLELQVVRTLEKVTARTYAECECGQPVDGSSLFCGDCGRAVRHG